MPDFLAPAVLALIDQADELAQGVLIPIRERGTRVDADTRRAITAASRAAGIFAMTQPRSVGGLESGSLELTAVREALGHHDVGHLPGIFGPGPGLLGGVGEPLHSSHLQPLLAGDKRAAFGFTEPDSAPRHTWARAEGDTLVVNGQKSYVTGGADADFINTLVHVDGSGPAMIVIDTDSPGVSMIRRFDSLDGSHHAAFAFEDVRVPAHRVIGAPGEGLRLTQRLVAQVRMGIAANSVGLCRYLVELVGDHLAAPHRSGEPLGAREGVRLRYGDLRIQAYAARSTLYRTARLIDSGAEIINEVMATKVFATETVGRLADAAVQLAGGQALTEGHPVEGVYRRVRTLRLAEGASDVLTINIARGALDLHKGRL